MMCYHSPNKVELNNISIINNDINERLYYIYDIWQNLSLNEFYFYNNTGTIE